MSDAIRCTKGALLEVLPHTNETLSEAYISNGEVH